MGFNILEFANGCIKSRQTFGRGSLVGIPDDKANAPVTEVEQVT